MPSNYIHYINTSGHNTHRFPMPYSLRDLPETLCTTFVQTIPKYKQRKIDLVTQISAYAARLSATFS